MLTFRDPLIALTAVTAGLQVVGGFQAARQAKAEAKAEASFLQFQQRQEEKQAGRELRDLREEERRASARTRAILAAQGVDLTSNTALDLLSDRATESNIREQRISEDSRTRRISLGVRAQNVKRSGRARASQEITGGLTRGFSTATTLFPRD